MLTTSVGSSQKNSEYEDDIRFSYSRIFICLLNSFSDSDLTFSAKACSAFWAFFSSLSSQLSVTPLLVVHASCVATSPVVAVSMTGSFGADDSVTASTTASGSGSFFLIVEVVAKPRSGFLICAVSERVSRHIANYAISRLYGTLVFLGMLQTSRWEVKRSMEGCDQTAAQVGGLYARKGRLSMTIQCKTTGACDFLQDTRKTVILDVI